MDLRLFKKYEINYLSAIWSSWYDCFAWVTTSRKGSFAF